MKDKEKTSRKTTGYTEVWGDTVNLKELFWASVLGIIFTLAFYMVGSNIFGNIEDLEPQLAKGYSLIVGVTGCIISAVISAKKFKPKRIIEERSSAIGWEDVLKNADMSTEEEGKALGDVDPQIIKELEELEMWSLLSLIPEGAPNYKEEYRRMAQEGAEGK